MATNQSSRDSLIALRDFIERTRRNCLHNGDILRARKKMFVKAAEPIAFSADALSAALSYAEDGEPHFIMLGSLGEGGKVDYRETEELLWCVNDAIACDALLASDRTVAKVFLDRAIVRATFLRCFLDFALRSFDTEQMKVAQAGGKPEDTKRFIAEALSDFEAGIKSYLDSAFDRTKVLELARAARFPGLPMVIGMKAEGAETINGVVLPAEMAQQFRAYLGRLQAQGLADRAK